MYQIEIDFLNDRRPRLSADTPIREAQSQAWLERYPALEPILTDPQLLRGAGFVGVGLLLIVLLGGWRLVLSIQKLQLQGQLGGLESRSRQAAQLQKQIAQAEQETRDLKRVFETAQSWNNLLTDLARRTPNDVQLTSVKEQEGLLTIQGRASRYPSVVVLLQNLRRAPYLNPKARLVIDSAQEVSLDVPLPRAAAPPSPAPEQSAKAIYVGFSISGRLLNPFPVSPRN